MDSNGEGAAFVHVLNPTCGRCICETSSRPFAHAHTKGAASQIAPLIQSQRTLFIHYLFSGCAIVAGHCVER